jgi:hypothetical protein
MVDGKSTDRIDWVSIGGQRWKWREWSGNRSTKEADHDNITQHVEQRRDGKEKVQRVGGRPEESTVREGILSRQENRSSCFSTLAGQNLLEMQREALILGKEEITPRAVQAFYLRHGVGPS